MLYLSESINSLTDEFRSRVEELLDNSEVELLNLSQETLARWISEEFSKFLVEKDEQDAPKDEDYDDRDTDSESWDSRE